MSSKKRVFISGSFDGPEFWYVAGAQQFTAELVKALVENDCHIVTGYGKNIGESVVAGAYSTIHEFPEKLWEWVTVRPFPFNKEIKLHEKVLSFSEYREVILGDVDCAIAIYGVKYNDKKELINASGVRSEIELCKEHYKIPVIPVGSTGYAAKELYDEMENYRPSTLIPGKDKEWEKNYLKIGAEFRQFDDIQRAELIESIINLVNCF